MRTVLCETIFHIKTFDELALEYSLALDNERRSFDALAQEEFPDIEPAALTDAFRSFIKVIMMQDGLRNPDKEYPPVEVVRHRLAESLSTHREKLRSLLYLLLGNETEWETLERGEEEAKSALDQAERQEDVGGMRLGKSVLDILRKRKEGQ